MTATTLISAPSVQTLSFQALLDKFVGQVLETPYEGQRNHAALLKMGRHHITAMPNVPTTQAIFQAVRFVDEPSVPVLLVDGYQRIQHWYHDNAGCPFSNVILIVHDLLAKTSEEKMRLTDELARTIDNRVAAKTKADRWYSGMRAAGFKPESKGYALGQDMNLYLEQTLGSAKQSLPELAASVKSRFQDHLQMDTLLDFAEVHLADPMRRKFFHAGIALAVFDKLKTCERSAELLKTVRSALLLSSGYSWPNPPKAVELLSAQLNYLAQRDTRDRMLESCNDRKEYFLAVAVVIGNSLDNVIAEL